MRTFEVIDRFKGKYEFLNVSILVATASDFSIPFRRTCFVSFEVFALRDFS